MIGKLSMVSRVKLTREANVIERAHTIPHATSYNVGLHKANMLDMLVLLYPDAPRAAYKWIIQHDTPERFIGDIPSPAKWAGIVDLYSLGIVERDINRAVYQFEHLKLDGEWQQRLKGLDLLELYLWALDQIMMGNRNLNTMRMRIERYVLANDVFPEEQYSIFKEAQRNWNMMPDLGEY